MNVRKVEVVSKIFQDFKDRKGKTQLIQLIAKVVVVVVILLAITFLVAGCTLFGIPKAHAEDSEIVNVECRYFAAKGNDKEYSPVFKLPVDTEKGFLYYLENGFSPIQKQIMHETARKFYYKKGNNQNYTAVGMICTGPNGPGKVSVILEKLEK